MNKTKTRAMLALGAALLLLSAGPVAQDRLKSMPGYEQFQKMQPQMAGAIKPGALTVTWKDDSRTFEYTQDGKVYSYDVAARKATEVGPATPPAAPAGVRGAMLERGRQAASAASPDGTWKAVYRDRNLYLTDAKGENEVAITTDGNARDRVKYGTASWVYGEELAQTSAIWWSPDSRKVAFYRFDEKQVPDYFLQLDQTKLYSKVDQEPYPKAGEPNPIADVLVYDVASKRTVKIDVRDGKPFDNSVVGHYVYRVAWSPDGQELLFFRSNRRHNIRELVAANPSTGACRVVVHDEWPSGWLDDDPAPPTYFLKDGKRFVYVSERSGWKNLYLYDLSGKLLAPLTRYEKFEAGDVVRIDEDAKVVYFTARDGDNFMKMQLHRVGLDGTKDTRLTDPRYNHSVASCMPRAGMARPANCGISPDGKYFVDVYLAHDVPPATRLVETSGKVVAELAKSDTTKADAIGLKRAELFTYKAADGATELYGLLYKPSNFDPGKKYPLLVSVYAGPATNGASENFSFPNALTEYGFLVASLDSRSAAGRGKKFLDAIYMKLGTVEMDDQAAGVRALWERPYVDKERVGIFGTSYGGYASLMCLLRHPEVFRAAVAGSAVTAWYHYDTIYTERFMWIPQENKEGYEAGNAMNLASKLNGRLLIYYGTADNNVHPSNSMQLIQALQRAGKSFEVQVGPDQGHSGLNAQRMMEFFIENLVMNKPPAGTD
ncbi:MAG: DPP IV N-terminal domain-containing protein [Bacteroidales bacterium]